MQRLEVNVAVRHLKMSLSFEVLGVLEIALGVHDYSRLIKVISNQCIHK